LLPIFPYAPCIDRYIGAHTYRLLPPLDSNCTGLDGKTGWTLEFFEQGKKEKPVKTINGFKEANYSPLLDTGSQWKDVLLSATFVPKASGSHYLSCAGIGPTSVSINNKVIYEQKHNSEDAMAFLFGGNPEKQFTYSFNKGESYEISVQSSPPITSGDEDGGILSGRPGFRLGFMSQEEHDEDLLSTAVDLARDCDMAIVFTGHTPVWETEGQDQVGFHLPKDGSQDKLVDAIASVNPKTIVVNSTGVAVAMPWLSKVSAVLQAWFPGQEAGNAIADVVSGAVNPSGKLPISWPKQLEDTPAYGNFPGVKKDGQLTVQYNEGVFVGYRHYDRISKEKLQFPFGFGLSYTSFNFKDARVSQPSPDTFNTSIAVSNLGQEAGATVVQLYIGLSTHSVDHPIKTLAAFKKVLLEAGEEKRVELPVSLKDFAYFDEASGSWKVAHGKYDFSFAQSAADVVSVVTMDINGSRQLLL
jgi:beta-glucosidase